MAGADGDNITRAVEALISTDEIRFDKAKEIVEKLKT
jgi:hypothetical protein